MWTIFSGEIGSEKFNRIEKNWRKFKGIQNNSKETGGKVENWIELKILFFKIQWHSDEFIYIYGNWRVFKIIIIANSIGIQKNSSKFKRIEEFLLNSKVFDGNKKIQAN